MLPGVPGKFQAFMDALVTLEKTIHPDLPVYRWQPYSFEPPAVFNWLGDSPFEIRDQSRWRDTLQVLVRVGCRYTEQNVLMEKVEEFTDAARETLDAAFAADQTLGGTAREVHRTLMRFSTFHVGDIDVFGPELVVSAQIDRHLSPN